MLTLARKAGFVARPSPDVAGLMLLEKVLPAPPTMQLGNDQCAASLPAA